MSRALITRKIEIDLGHRVPNHKSKCRNLHGHRYVFEVGVQGALVQTPGASDEGMVIDYGDIKELLIEHIHDPFDHGFMIYSGDPFRETLEQLPDQKIIVVPFIPTAENLAEHVFGRLAPALSARSLELRYVRVWETPNCTAIFGKQL